MVATFRKSFSVTLWLLWRSRQPGNHQPETTRNSPAGKLQPHSPDHDCTCNLQLDRKKLASPTILYPCDPVYHEHSRVGPKSYLLLEPIHFRFLPSDMIKKLLHATKKIVTVHLLRTLHLALESNEPAVSLSRMVQLLGIERNVGFVRQWPARPRKRT